MVAIPLVPGDGGRSPRRQLMIVVFSDDRTVQVLRDFAAVQAECEAFDVKAGVYRFFDLGGRRLIPHFTESVHQTSGIFGLIKSIDGGRFILTADLRDASNELIALLDSAVDVEPNPWVANLAELRRLLQS